MSNRDEADPDSEDVWEMGTDGSNPTRLTHDPSYGYTGPDWRPPP